MQLRIAAVAAAMVVCSIGCTAGAGPLTLQRILPNPSPNNGDNFGQGVSLSGGKALVGAPFDATTGSSSGQAYIIDAASGTVLRTLANPGTAPTTNDFFGQSVSLSGNNALVGVQNDDTGASNSGVSLFVQRDDGRAGAHIHESDDGDAATVSDTPLPSPATSRSFPRPATPTDRPSGPARAPLTCSTRRRARSCRPS